jgi:hypothetical protein
MGEGRRSVVGKKNLDFVPMTDLGMRVGIQGRKQHAPEFTTLY